MNGAIAFLETSEDAAVVDEEEELEEPSSFFIVLDAGADEELDVDI
jgi:hypothetical protein